jgi:lysozyme family protein
MSDNPVTDPNGGLTRFGISQTQNPKVDVAGLTRDTAIAFYKAKYWDADGCGKLPWPLSFLLFDSAVNQGTKTAVKFLQRAVGAVIDGQIGPQTIGAVAKRDPIDLSARFCAYRIVGYTMDSEWSADGNGWSYRVCLNCLDV